MRVSVVAPEVMLKEMPRKSRPPGAELPMRSWRSHCGSATQIYPSTEEAVTITLQTVQTVCKLPGTVHALQPRLAITTKTDQSMKRWALACGPGTPRLLLMLTRTPTMAPIVTGSLWERGTINTWKFPSTCLFLKAMLTYSLIPYLKETETEQNIPHAF